MMMAEFDAPDASAAEKLAEFFGPEQIDQCIRQAVHFG
jgi:hypothetical protein